jgi:hypothetical protein
MFLFKSFFRKNCNKVGNNSQNSFDKIGESNQLNCVLNNGNCTVTANGNKCSYCRLKKCFRVGMDKKSKFFFNL